MKVEVRAETVRLLREELRLGHFRSIDELIREGVLALRARDAAERNAVGAPREPRQNLAEIEKEMVLEPESPDRLLPPARGLQQSSSVSVPAQIRLTCTYYASLCWIRQPAESRKGSKRSGR